MFWDPQNKSLFWTVWIQMFGFNEWRVRVSRGCYLTLTLFCLFLQISCLFERELFLWTKKMNFLPIFKNTLCHAAPLTLCAYACVCVCCVCLFHTNNRIFFFPIFPSFLPPFSSTSSCVFRRLGFEAIIIFAGVVVVLLLCCCCVVVVVLLFLLQPSSSCSIDKEEEEKIY